MDMEAIYYFTIFFINLYIVHIYFCLLIKSSENIYFVFVYNA